jgi:hypothetical protein
MKHAITIINEHIAQRQPPTFDDYGYLFGLMLEFLAPAERTIVETLARRGEQSTEQLQGDNTPQQVGATLSRLRRLKLVWTIRSGGVAYHDLDGWARIGAPMWRWRSSPSAPPDEPPAQP